MASVPRIVVVDRTPDVAHIVRGALALLSRQFILVEVPTADDALDEIFQNDTRLVVTAYDLAGEVNGIELARRINHESLATSVIVLARPDDPRFNGQLKNAPFQYYVRPVAETFLRGIRLALDGQSFRPEPSEPVSDPVDDLGPVPAVDIPHLEQIVVTLMRDVGAMGVIVADRTGRVLIDEGATGYIDRERLGVVLGPVFAQAGEISPLVGGNAWAMHYYDGERLDVFGLALGLHHFLGLIFEGASNRGAFGAVTMFGRRAADRIIELIGDAAYARPEIRPLPAQPVEADRAEPTEPADQPAFEVASSREPVKGQPPETAPDASVLAFDADRLFAQEIDEASLDEIFDPDKLGDLAEALSRDDDRVDYDGAVDMGILDE